MAKTHPEARRERLAAALRANLKRRKTGLCAEPGSTPDRPEPEPAQPDGVDGERDALSPAGEPR